MDPNSMHEKITEISTADGRMETFITHHEQGGTLLHGSVAGRSRPPAFAFMRDEGTLAGQARACGSARWQQWPPRSSAALWSVSAARRRSLACSDRYRPP